MKNIFFLLILLTTSFSFAQEKKALSVGGELRERVEYYSNYLWGRPLNRGDVYFLHRVMVHAQYEVSPQFKTFIEFKSNTVSDKILPARSIDKDELDLHQAYLLWSLDSSLSFKFGRQELSYGSSRLVSVREGPNVRQSFDALKINYSTDIVTIDFFASRPVETNPWMFDDRSDYAREFYGIYSTINKRVDAYYFLYENKDAVFHSGIAKESRSSLGLRFFSEKGASFDYDLEGVWQFGNYGTQSINAWTVATNNGYSFKSLPWPVRFGLKANIASGDHQKNDGSLNTFNPLFPKGAYFNEAAIIGPANIMDLHPSIIVNSMESLSFQVDWDFMWRHSLNDGLYNISMTPSVTAGNSKQRYIGSQLATSGSFKISETLSATAQYMHFYTGGYLNDQTGGKDIDFYTMWVTSRF